MVFIEIERRLPRDLVNHIISYVMSKGMRMQLEDDKVDHLFIHQDSFLRGRPELMRMKIQKNTDVVSDLLVLLYLRKQYPSILQVTIHGNIYKFCDDIQRIIQLIEKDTKIKINRGEF